MHDHWKDPNKTLGSMRILAEKIPLTALVAGDIFSSRGPEYWTAGRFLETNEDGCPPEAQSIMIRTEVPIEGDPLDAFFVYRLTIDKGMSLADS